jgi:hypothetical protein
MSMQALLQTLQDHDLGHLRIVAELWGFDTPTGTALQAAEALAQSMLDPRGVAEIHGSLPPDAAQILDLLLLRGGRIALADLERRAGPLRRMGPGKRDREKPWRKTGSILEFLWYRGLIATAFSDTATGPKEFAFIPSDLMDLLPRPSSPKAPVFGPPIDPPSWKNPASAAAVDDAATLLAALRRGPCEGRELPLERQRALTPFMLQPTSLKLLVALLVDLGIVTTDPLQPDPSATRDFLAQGRNEALSILLNAWADSVSWNDLAQISTLSTAGKDWPNDPLATRREVLELLREVPTSAWFDLDLLVQAVYDRQPDFQRPGGDFDSWYLQDEDTRKFLKGFAHWHQIEGALLHTMIKGPLHWLGAIDLGGPSPQHPATSFRLTAVSAALFDGEIPPFRGDDAHSVEIRSEGRITVPRHAPLAVRYQISRFCTWLLLDEAGYHFILTPSSLQHAIEQGLTLKHIQTLLTEATGDKIPPRLLKALGRWGERGREAHLERGIILHVDDAALLDELFARRAIARYLGERLGATAVAMRRRDLQPLLAAAARYGLLIDPLPPEDGLAP